MAGRSRLQWIVLVVALLAIVAAVVYAVGRARAPRAAAPEHVPEVVRTPEPPAGPRIRVEVLNASGRSGMARLGMERLRSQGFDVVYFGTARRRPEGNRSRVIDRVGDFATAQRVAEALGITQVESQPDLSLQLEATVILAGDWPGTPAGEESDSLESP